MAVIGSRSATEFGNGPRPPESEASHLSSGSSPLMMSQSQLWLGAGILDQDPHWRSVALCSLDCVI